ncbi:MAG: hypothetical protein FWF44_11615, partial [Defluviitaleaceae bacterium]|nr:hypothetical protein [Defluviitaleaceae bacterium]
MSADGVETHDVAGERGEAVEGKAHVHGIKAEESAHRGAGREHGRSLPEPAKLTDKPLKGGGLGVAGDA